MTCELSAARNAEAAPTLEPAAGVNLEYLLLALKVRSVSWGFGCLLVAVCLDVRTLTYGLSMVGYGSKVICTVLW